MHVEISVALNFVISYLYNKLPRRRVDLFGEELEVGLKEKFQGHWYPEQPSKGSGFRCLKGNGDEVDPVLVYAAFKAGLDITEVKSYLPDELTLWIDPSEVSYKIGEKGPVKVLYSDRKDEDGSETVDREVQAASRTFNPEAQTFTPECHQSFTPDILAFSPDVAAFCSDSTQSFQPIDSLSSSLSNLSLSPSSPVPPGTWSTATSPSSNLFSSAMTSSTIAPPPALAGSRPGNPNRQHFTAAMFAQTKFGSTKLKSQAKRPNRLSPTEFGNYFRQQHRNYAGPQRPRSLSPRDPRVEFLIDQQQRMYQQQQQQQLSPSMPYGPQFQLQQQQQGLHHQQQQQQGLHHQQQQQLSPTGLYPELYRQNASALSSAHSSPHLSPLLSPHISPPGNGPSFQDLIQSNPNLSTIPSSAINPISRPSSLTNLRRPTGFPSLNSPLSNSSSHAGSMGKMFSPESHKPFVDGFNVASVNYSNNLHQLLMAN